MKTQTFKSGIVCLLLSVITLYPAKAQIDYTDINPDTTTTTGNSQNTLKTFDLDLNNDGTVDFNIQTYRTHSSYYIYPQFYVRVTPLNKNEVLDFLSGSDYYPVALGLNSHIVTNLLWRNTSNQILRKEVAGYYWGFWSLNTDAYLGLKVIVASDTSYGWVRLSIQKNSAIISFTVKDYANNTIPNQPILAGETICTTPTVNLTQSGSLSFCAGDSVTLTANGTGYQYQWKKKRSKYFRGNITNIHC